MTIETSQARISYSITGSGPYTIPFRFLNDADIKVLTLALDGLTQATLVLNTDYTLSGAGDSAGTLTLIGPDDGYTLTIINSPEVTQLVDYPEAGKFPAESHERALDKLTIILNRVMDLFNKTIKINDSDSITGGLPLAQANKYIGFNSSKAVALLDAPNLTDTLAAQAAAEAAADAIDGFENVGARTNGVTYYKNNLVRDGGSTYLVIADPSYVASASAATDIANGHIAMFAQKGDAGAGSGDLVAANNLSELTATAATVRNNLGLGTAAIKATGATVGSVPLWESVPLNAVTAKSANYTILAADRGKLFKCTNAITLSLTAAATLGDGFAFAVRNNGTSDIIIDPNASETIDGAATITLKPNKSCLVVCDGAGFNTVGKQDNTSHELLGILTTTSGTSQSLAGLDLAKYSFLYMMFYNVTCGSAQNLMLDNQIMCTTLSPYILKGDTILDLANGRFRCTYESSTGASGNDLGDTSYDNSTNTLTFNFSGGAAFTGGEIKIWGII